MEGCPLARVGFSTPSHPSPQSHFPNSRSPACLLVPGRNMLFQVEELAGSSCDLRQMCHWRFTLAAARGVSAIAQGSASVFERDWYEWGRSRNATEIFEGYLRRMMRLPTTAPALPCSCQRSQSTLFLKFFFTWLEPLHRTRLRSKHTFQRRFMDDEGMRRASAWDHVHARLVFDRLGAKARCLQHTAILYHERTTTPVRP
jgi:hypothetical protein